MHVTQKSCLHVCVCRLSDDYRRAKEATAEFRDAFLRQEADRDVEAVGRGAVDKNPVGEASGNFICRSGHAGP